MKKSLFNHSWLFTQLDRLSIAENLTSYLRRRRAVRLFGCYDESTVTGYDVRIALMIERMARLQDEKDIGDFSALGFGILVESRPEFCGLERKNIGAPVRVLLRCSTTGTGEGRFKLCRLEELPWRLACHWQWADGGRDWELYEKFVHRSRESKKRK